MPHDDLAHFLRLQPPARVRDIGNLPGVVTAVSWPDAVAQFWLVQPPRVIATTDGGASFQVVGNSDLTLEPSGTQPNAPRCEVFRWEVDSRVPVLGDSTLHWVPASPTTGYEKQPFYCMFVNAHTKYGQYRRKEFLDWCWIWEPANPQIKIYGYMSRDAGGPDTIAYIEVTDDSNATTAGTLPTGPLDIASAGRVELRMTILSNPGGTKSWTVSRCIGQTPLTTISDGRQVMAHGWVFREGSGKFLFGVRDMSKDDVAVDNVIVQSRRCWKDNEDRRIMYDADVDTSMYSWQDCIRKAAKRARTVVGIQAGGECWIPRSDELMVETIADRSDGSIYDPPCSPWGAAKNMHLYTMDEGTRKQLETRFIPKTPKQLSRGPIWDRGCWRDHTRDRMMQDADVYFKWSLEDCTNQTARSGHSVFGMQAGNECWIPRNRSLTTENIVERSAGPFDAPCGDTGAADGMRMYSMDESMADAYTQPQLVWNEVALPPWPGTNESKATVISHGCFIDRDEARIMHGDKYGWDLNGCAHVAARWGKAVFGRQAGNECWLPSDNNENATIVAARSVDNRAKNCGPDGEAWMMHLYGIDAANREKLKAIPG